MDYVKKPGNNQAISDPHQETIYFVTIFMESENTQNT